MDDQAAQTQPVSDSVDTQDNQLPEVDQAVESVRRQAVEALLPVLDSVDGPAEHKFELIMNALEASPNLALLQKALAAAQAIENPSAKAEALVDVINASNY